jgi:hypothetical protein
MIRSHQQASSQFDPETCLPGDQGTSATYVDPPVGPTGDDAERPRPIDRDLVVRARAPHNASSGASRRCTGRQGSGSVPDGAMGQGRAQPAIMKGGGTRPVLLLVDLYRWVFGDEPEPLLEAIGTWPGSCGLDGWEALPHISRLLGEARALGIPVVHGGRRMPGGGSRNARRWLATGFATTGGGGAETPTRGPSWRGRLARRAERVLQNAADRPLNGLRVTRSSSPGSRRVAATCLMVDARHRSR